MNTQVRISAKNLGELAMPSFCPRCFWLKLKLNNRLPFQIFPGIFRSIDLYTKDVIHALFDREGKPPVWLKDLGELVAYQKPPHYSKFNILDNDSNVLLTGEAAGLIYLNGEGISAALDSGHRCGKAVAQALAENSNAAERYREATADILEHMNRCMENLHFLTVQP